MAKQEWDEELLVLLTVVGTASARALSPLEQRYARQCIGSIQSKLNGYEHLSRFLTEKYVWPEGYGKVETPPTPETGGDSQAADSAEVTARPAQELTEAKS